MNDQVEIRLLGRLWIRLADGSVVPAVQWKTGKTTDLLRLLALQSDQIVSTSSIIEKLWPGVPAANAAASLHTATAQIRKVLGKNSITRHLSGLQLLGCWVDAAAFRDLGAEIGRATRSREFAKVVTAAQQAEALYVDDFHAHDDDSGWAADIREQLLGQRKVMLVEGAESAIELGWMRDAIAMATLAISLDSAHERAHRALMQAYAGIGESDSAVRSYERCRRNLKAELGVSPSPQTESLYVRLTSPAAPSRRFASYVGRDTSVEELSRAIRHSSHGDGADLVCVIGEPGSGREELLRTAADRVTGSHVRPVRPPKVARQAPVKRMEQRDGLTDIAVMGPVDLPPARAHIAIAETLATIPPQSGRVLVVITTPETADFLREGTTGVYRPHIVDSPRMDRQDLTELALTILAGHPSPDLVTELESRSAHLAGMAVTTLNEWAATGQVISTIRGLGLITDTLNSTVLPAASTSFRVLAEQLDPADIEICQVMAVLDRPASAADVMSILGSERKSEKRRMEFEARMDRLTNRRLFEMADDFYQFRDRTTQDLFELWLRPSLQERIAHQIAEDDSDDQKVTATS